jgi:uncharacterized protein
MNRESSKLTGSAMLWRGIDRPGQEYARLKHAQSQWHLEGVAIFVHEEMPCRLDYKIICESDWRTTSCSVSGWVGEKPIAIEIKTEASGKWFLNGSECPEVKGCLDVDLNFSPSTNLLPIRRLALHAGQAAEVKAAWLRFPSFELEPLEQVYQRIDDQVYRYSSAGGAFVAELTVNHTGLVIYYPNLWIAE